jgi:hypothetical protein
MAQIDTEQSQHGHTVESGASAQVFHGFEPATRNVGADWSPWLEFAHQKAIKVSEYFMVAFTLASKGNAHLPKFLEP